MVKEIAASLRWSTILGAKFLQVFPLGTLASIALTFLAQLALIASLLLPLKIVMIMSSGNIPNIFPEFFRQFGEQYLIGGITALAIGAFIFNNLAGKLTEKLAQVGVDRLHKRNDKLTLFENQETLSETAYLKYSSSIASLIFVIAGLVILAIVYPEIAITISIFTALCVAGYTMIWNYSQDARSALIEKLPAHLNFLGNIGFLTAFLTIVVDYIIDSIPGFLSVLLSIILARQLFSQMVIAINGVSFLAKQKEKLQALFFRDMAFTPTKNYNASIWSFLESSALQESLIMLVHQEEGNKGCDYHIRWHETGLPNILFMILTSDSDSEKKFLIKVFDKQKSAEARHEAALLLQSPDGLPSPKLLSVSVINGHHVHLFDLHNHSEYVKGRPKNLIRDFELRLLSIQPPTSLSEQYQRSKSMLWNRIDHSILERLRLIATPQEQRILDIFESRLPEYRTVLKSLQPVIANPTRNSKLYVRDGNGHLASIHWGKWTLEPFASGMHVTDETRSPKAEQLQHLIDQAETKNGLTPAAVSLAFNFGRTEALTSRQCYRSAIEALSDINDLSLDVD